MVKAERKPIEEIKEAIGAYNKVLITGCGGCVSVCLVGGQRETLALKAELGALYKKENRQQELDEYTVERQCNDQFLEELDSRIQKYDCVLSMACGAGVQNTAKRFPGIPVFPAVNTVSIGIDKDIGMYEERCRACGHCVLGYTGGICPVTRCSKGLFNGPCGGTNIDSCEVSNEVPCAWLEIYHRLKAQDRLDDIKKIHTPMEWHNQTPRTIIQEPYQKRYRA